MYSLFMFSSNLVLWQTRYCASDYTSCVRFTKGSAGEPVPQNLLPNGKLLQLKGAK